MVHGYGYGRIWIWMTKKVSTGYPCRTLSVGHCWPSKAVSHPLWGSFLKKIVVMNITTMHPTTLNGASVPTAWPAYRPMKTGVETCPKSPPLDLHSTQWRWKGLKPGACYLKTVLFSLLIFVYQWPWKERSDTMKKIMKMKTIFQMQQGWRLTNRDRNMHNKSSCLTGNLMGEQYYRF